MSEARKKFIQQAQAAAATDQADEQRRKEIEEQTVVLERRWMQVKPVIAAAVSEVNALRLNHGAKPCFRLVETPEGEAYFGAFRRSEVFFKPDSIFPEKRLYVNLAGSGAVEISLAGEQQSPARLIVSDEGELFSEDWLVEKLLGIANELNKMTLHRPFARR